MWGWIFYALGVLYLCGGGALGAVAIPDWRDGKRTQAVIFLGLAGVLISSGGLLIWVAALA